jgi:hypothetical protein
MNPKSCPWVSDKVVYISLHGQQPFYLNNPKKYSPKKNEESCGLA